MLPEYIKEKINQDTDQARRLLESDGRSSTDTAPPLYPPTSISGRHEVEYSYTPTYPRTGRQECAVGILGPTKQETVKIVQRGMPGLANLDPDRITFRLLINEPKYEPYWVTILDEAWERFDDNPPKRLAVVVTDLPGDYEKRDRRDCWECIQILGIIAAVILFVVGIYKICNM